MSSDYNVTATYRIPIVKALALHLMILTLFASSWEPNHESEPKPEVIVQARMLSMNDPILARQKREQEKLQAQRHIAEQRKQEEAKRKKAEEKRKAEQRRKEDERKRVEQQKREEARKAEERRKAEKKRQQEEAERVAQEQRQREQEAQRQLEDEFASALAEESELMQQQSDLNAVQSYLGLIQQRIRENWHRPLSARNGMKTLLRIHMVPTGEVQNVYIVDSSGDAAFDRSAIQAVQRAEKFPELQNLEPRVFDQHFRTMRMLFNPVDLDR